MPKAKTDSISTTNSKTKSSSTSKTAAIGKSKKTRQKRVKTQHDIDLETRRKQHEQTVQQARNNNLKNEVESGEISCAKLQHRFAKGVDKKWPFRSGYKNVNCCSSAPGIFKQLSPMKLGPIEYEEVDDKGKVITKITATNLENLWQFSKVWPEDVDPKTKLPNSEWYKRRRAGFLDQKPHRHVNRHTPLYAFWKGQKLNYMESRRRIYCPLYAQLVVETDAYKKLKKLVSEDKYNVNILGYDGFDYESARMTLKQCFNDTSRPFGHELVLCCLLKGEHVWEEEEGEDDNEEEDDNDDDEASTDDDDE